MIRLTPEEEAEYMKWVDKDGKLCIPEGEEIEWPDPYPEDQYSPEPEDDSRNDYRDEDDYIEYNSPGTTSIADTLDQTLDHDDNQCDDYYDRDY